LHRYRTFVAICVLLVVGALPLGACAPYVYRATLISCGAGCRPHGIACCTSDSAVWFTDPAENKILRLATDGRFTKYDIPTPDSKPENVAIGYHCATRCVWFTERKGNKIGLLAENGNVREFRVPTHSSEPFGLSTDGQGVWFTERAGNKIGHVGQSDKIVEYNVPTPHSGPLGISAGERGGLGVYWFTESTANRIGMINEYGKISEFKLPHRESAPWGIASDPENAWFTERKGNRIGMITADNRVIEADIPTPSAYPSSIFEGRDTIWFLESGSGKIGVRYFPTISVPERPGVDHEFDLSKLGPLNLYSAFPGGGIWFTAPLQRSVGFVHVYIPSYP